MEKNVTTAVTETLEQEYSRLVGEQNELSAAARKNAGPSAEDRDRHREVTLRLRELLAIPPAGYALPAAAAGLVAHAEAHGWLTLVQWTSLGYDGAPFVTIQVGRQLREGEMPDARGNKWIYKVTWHSYGCQPGKVRLFSSGAETPGRPVYHDGPSVKAIRAVIEQHPAQEDAS
jgi:hypothetical protein